jgi:hypothetical protein
MHPPAQAPACSELALPSGLARHGEAIPPAESPQPAPAAIEPRRSEPPAVAERIEPRNHRELAQAISAECDLVQIGLELLQSGTERGASVRARMFETLANWRFGQPAGQPAAAGKAGSKDGSNVRIIWDLPCPPHEPRDVE